MGLGFLLAALSIRLVAMDGNGTGIQAWQALALLSTPAYDVLRVMVDRARRHGKLFRPERNHLHHIVIGQGISHRVAMLLIVLANGLVAGLALIRPDLQWYQAIPVMSLAFLLAVGIFRNLSWYRLRREANHLRTEMTPLSSENPFFDRSLLSPK